jgi:predicted extracellular nuclease
MKKYFLLSFLFVVINISAQEVHRIFNLPKNNEKVITNGIVTLIFEDEYGNKQAFIQDKYGDGNPETTDAILLKLLDNQQDFNTGNEIFVYGKLSTDGVINFLDSVSIASVSTDVTDIEAQSVVFPDDFSDYSQYEGMTLTFNQTLVVTDNSKWQRYGELVLSSLRLPSPTDLAAPLSDEYQRIVANNRINWLYLDDGSSVQYPNPLPFADADGTRRTGSRTNNLTAVLHHVNWAGGVQWALYPVSTAPPVFYGNSRPASPETAQEYNLKVCSFNLEYYLASNYGQGYGAENEAEAAIQHNKILQAVTAIDADIYGFVEIQTGQAAMQKLCNAMNEQAGGNIYAYINDNTPTNGTYTKAGFIYRTDRVVPEGSIKSIDIGSIRNRMKTQCFKLSANGEKFIFSLNHLKSKSGNGSGGNADTGDGQGAYNSDRVAEVQALLNDMPSYYTHFGDDDVLIMGDLNAYRQENPLQLLYNNGFQQLLEHDSIYSYSYDGTAGCLDHALANSTMAQQVASASVFHINADEPSMFEYNKATWQNNMYRCSDHDAVVVTLKLGNYTDTILIEKDKIKVWVKNNLLHIINAKNQWVTLIDVSGKQILHKFVKENSQVFDLSDKYLPVGVYVAFLDDMKSAHVKPFKIMIAD